MPEPKRPLKVFLCHAHADRDSVRGLYTRLTQDGVDAWLDKAKLLPGQDWELEIRKAVREADVVVVCLSKQFNQAGFRQKEVRLALDTAMEKPEGEIFIIPARLEECDTLESLRKWHWVDLFEADGYEMLMRALRTRADKIKAKLLIEDIQSPLSNSKAEKNQLYHLRKDERQEDIKILKSLLKHLDLLAIENFLKNPKSSSYQVALSWDLFNEIVSSIAFYLYDHELLLHVKKFHDSYKYVMSFSNYFFSTGNEESLMFVIEDEESRAAYKEYSELVIPSMSHELDNLIAYIRKEYSEADLFELNFSKNNREANEYFSVPNRKSKTKLDVFVAFFGVLVIIFVGVWGLLEKATSSISPTSEVVSDTAVVTTVPEISPSLVTEPPVEITDAKGVSMVLVPAGEFTMGSASGNNDEKPAHAVYLNEFYIDKFEVTNALYRACVEDEGCEALTRSMRFTLTKYDQHPVAFVKWDQARTYCTWRGGHLPTEAEWEKAARGINKLTYPWGGGFDCDRVNLATCVGDTVTVGSYEGGKSPYGSYDMSGNVWEWVEDWYSEVYYTDSRVDSPTGADSGRMRVIRGGAWDSSYLDIRTYTRDGAYPSGIKDNIGFRCVRDSNP